jgi:hypothetical protein
MLRDSTHNRLSIHVRHASPLHARRKLASLVCLAALAAAVALPLHSCGVGARSSIPAEAGLPMPAAESRAVTALDGQYRVTFTAPLVGTISTRMVATTHGNAVTAQTRRGVAWDFIGGIEGVLGQVFIPKLFPSGVILTWNTPLPSEGEVAEGTIGAGKYKDASVLTRMTDPRGDIELISKDGRKIAVMRLEPEAGSSTMADYKAMARNIERAVGERIYDKYQADSGAVRSYLRQVRRNAGMAKDDVEFIFGAAIAGRNIKFSLPLVMKDADLNSNPLTQGWSESDLATTEVKFDENTRIAEIRFDAFLGAEDVDKAFQQALKHDPIGIFIDVRNCPGVTLASLRVISWIATAPVDAGIFFGQKHRDQVIRGRTADIPVLTLDSAASVAEIEKSLDAQGAGRVMIHPIADPFTGPVAVRISKKTTTSAEPMVHILKQTGRAGIFGNKTAGRPYLSRPIDISQGWVLWLATCDYRDAAGRKIDKGIEPDAAIPSKNQARLTAIKWLQQHADDSAQ